MTVHVDDLDVDPVLYVEGGRRKWLFPSGRMVPDVRGGDGPDDDDKKFTQEDVDRMITARLKNVKSDPPADYDELKAAAAELVVLKAAAVKADEAGKSEAEKVTARFDALEAQLKAATEATAQAQLQASQEKRRSAVVAAASIAKAANPEQVFALIPQDAVTIGDDGQVTGAVEAVKSFLDTNPHFVGKTGVPQPDRGQGKTGETKSFGDGGRAEALKRFGAPAGAGAGAGAAK